MVELSVPINSKIFKGRVAELNVRLAFPITPYAPGKAEPSLYQERVRWPAARLGTAPGGMKHCIRMAIGQLQTE